MGNTNGASKFERTGAIADLQLLGKNSSIRWGELLEMRNNKNNQLIFLQERYVRDLESCKKTIERCNKASMSTHPNIVSIYGCAGDETPDKFTNMYKACIFFEHVSTSLKLDIRNRINASVSPNLKASQFAIPSSHYFKEAEFSNMISQFVDGLHFLQDNDIHIGDITPDVCFLSNNNTTIKLLDKTLIYGGVSSFEIARRGGSQVFLTPTELENLRNQVEEEPYQDRFKADVFRLGMTLLECATLQKSSQLYDFNNYKIDLDLLSTRLVKVKERYSPFIYDLLREMLRFEEYRRPDFMDLQADIARHHNTAGKKGIGTPKKRNIIINNTLTPQKSDVTPTKKGSLDVTPPKSRKQKDLSESWKTPDSGVRKSVTSMGPKLFMSNSPIPQIDPTIRKQSPVNLPKKNQFDLPVPLGAGHSKKRSRILNSECEIMDTGADLSKTHGIPYVMEGKESNSPSFRPEKQIVESSIKLIPKQIESENSLDDGKESGNSDSSQQFRTPLNREIRIDHNPHDSSTEYQVTFGKNSAPSTRRQSNQWNIVPIQVSHQKSPDQSFEGAFSLLHSQAQSRRDSGYGQSKPRHRSHLSMDGSKMMYHQPSPARSETKTEYYSAYSNSIGSRLNISHESGHQDVSSNKPATNIDGPNKSTNSMLPPRKAHLGLGDETPEQYSSKPPIYHEKEPIGHIWKRVFNSQVEPSPLSSSTTLQQSKVWPPLNGGGVVKHERPQRNSGHFYQGSVDFGKLSLYQQPPTATASLVNEREEARFGKFAPVPTPSFGAKRLFIEEPNLQRSLQKNDKDLNAAGQIKRLKESTDLSKSPKPDEARNSAATTATDNKDVDVDARFKMAMERSKRSTGYIMNITQKMGAKSHSRSSSIDAGALNLPVGTTTAMPKIDIFGANSLTIYN